MRAADHPRSRGVYGRPLLLAFVSWGSSPLARGLPEAREGPSPPARIIPARAGFTCGSRPPGGRRWDHPRSRGVYHENRFDLLVPEGSSPLARGLLASPLVLAVPGRIIPARAGFTAVQRDGAQDRPDHPRSRGVYIRLFGLRASFFRSSPLARGLLIVTDCPGRIVGIIPARAGFTSRFPRGRPEMADHPRSRGVYHPLLHPPRGHLRIIPARAGFTIKGCMNCDTVTDHPRSRGVYAILARRVSTRVGSSPLARGLHERHR